jgi:hypothetical protein
MSSFWNITRPTNLLILINRSNIILYETKGPVPTAKLTVPLGINYSALQQFLKDFKEPVIKIIIDQTSTTRTKFSIPDIGKVKIEKKLKSFLKQDNPDISTSLTAREPQSVDKNWEFIIAKHTLDQNTKSALSTLLESDSEVQGIYLSFSLNIILCQQISKTITKKYKIPKEKDLFIYMQDSNDHIYEFEMSEYKVVRIKSQALKKENIATYINKQLVAHHEESITKKRKISAIVLLPEQTRTHINTHIDQFFISPLDLYKKYTKNTISTQYTYTALLCHFNFLKNAPQPLPIRQIRKLKTLYVLNKSMKWLFGVFCALLIYSMITMALYYQDTQEDIHIQEKTLNLLQKSYNHSLQENLLKSKLLRDNKNARSLYHLIRFNNYSTRILDIIEKSNTEDLPIQQFRYFSPIESSNKNIIELELDQKKVKSIKTFVKNMKQNLPEREIISFLRNSGEPTIVIQILLTNLL